MSLRKRTVNGAIWTFIDLLFNRGAYLIATIVLANLLGPKEFGLIGMISLFVAIGNSLVDCGMTTSLLRLQIVTQTDYSTVFITNILMSVFVYLIVYLLAPSIANFYNQDILKSIIRIYCIGFILSSLRGIQTIKLMKELDFKKLMILNIPGNIISTVVSILMGLRGFGVWSLVALFLINQTISTLVYWIYVKWKPNWIFDFSCYKFHLRFGYKLVLSSQLNIFFENIYNVLIGKFINVKMVGYYERAFTFNNYPTSIISGIIQKVSIPALIHVKNNNNELREVYKNMMLVTFLISSVTLSAFSLSASPLINLILGPAWLEMIPLFQILSLSFILYPIHSFNVNILTIFGRSDLFLKIEVYKKTLVIILIIIGFQFGVVGLVWSNVVASILSLLINTFYTGKFINYSTVQQLKDLLPTSFIVIITSGIVILLKSIMKFNNNINSVSFIIISFISLIIFFSEVFKLNSYYYIKRILIEKILK